MHRIASGDKEFEWTGHVAEVAFMLAPDAILIVDKDGIIIKINQQAEFMFGYTQREAVGQHVEILIPERLRNIHEQHRREFAEQPRTRPMGLGLSLHGVRKDGREVPIDAALGPVATEDGMIVIVTVRRRLEKHVSRTTEIIRVISGKNPFQAWTMAFLMTACVPLMFVAAPPTSVSAILPRPAVIAWATTLVLSAMFNILGIYWRGSRPDTGLLIEQASCGVFAIGNLVYPAALMVYAYSASSQFPNTSSIWYTVVLLLGLTAAAVGRMVQIRSDRKEVSNVVKLMRQAGIPTS